MRATDAQKLLSLYGEKSNARAEAIATQLRRIGLLPKGARGLNAPEISRAEAALFALVVAGATTVATAAADAIQIFRMRNSAGYKLHHVLARYFAGKDERDILAIRVMVDSGGSEVLLRVGQDKVLVERYVCPGVDADNLGTTLAGQIGHLGAEIIQQFRLDFSVGQAAAQQAQEVHQ